MKKIYLLLVAFVFLYKGTAQTLNQSAEWPNTDWTITGNYSTAAIAFEADPTVTANFAFDDDDAGQNHEDNIAAESPVIDLTPAFTAGETAVEVIVDYGYRTYQGVDVLRVEYWNADTGQWVIWGTIPTNNTSVTDNFCTIPKTTYVTPPLSIGGFTPTQLSGFRYRLFFDDNPLTFSWQYGFCFNSPTIKSISCAAPSGFVVSGLTHETATITWSEIDGVVGFEYVLDEVNENPSGSGTSTTENSFSATDLSPVTPYYFHVRTVCTAGFSDWRTVPFATTTEPLVNDFCETAIDLGNEVSPLSATTVGALNNNLNTCTGSGPLTTNAYPDVYYFITIPDGSTLTIGQTVNNYDSTNVVFYGDCDNRTQIACFDDPDTNPVVWNNNTGSEQNVYWIQDGHSGSGTFTLAWTVIACTQPAATFAVNSLCENGTDEFETVTNITDMGSASSITVSDNQGYSEVVTTTGPVVLGPYSNGTSVTVTITNDDDSDCYQVSGALTQSACPPDNDNCDGAYELVVNDDFSCGSVTAGTVAGATGSTVTGNTCFGNPNNDVWFTFEATMTSHRISILNTTPSTDMYHSLWTGDCDGLTLVPGSCSDADTSNPGGLVPGQIYFVRVYSYSAANSSATFNICVGSPPPPPVNDICATALDLTNETSPLQSTTVGATNANLNTCISSGPIATNAYPDVYYFITVPNGSTLTMGQTENNYDSTNVVFYGDCDNRTQIACFDDPDTNQVVWSNNTGSEQNVYWIQDGHSGSGTFTLAWTVIACTQPEVSYGTNSLCENGTDEFETVTNITDMGSASSITVSDDQGFSQTVTTTGPVVLGPYPNNTPVIVTVVNDDDANCTKVSGTLNQVACPPANDNCDGAYELVVNDDFSCGNVTAGTVASATGSTVTGNTCFGNPNNDVWFSFTATATSHRISILNTTPATDMYHSLWTGSCDGLTLVPGSCSDSDTSNPTSLVLGQVYFVRVYSYGAASSTATFNICIGTPPPPPANDLCENAIPLEVGGVFADYAIMGTNEGASRDAADPVPSTACDGLNFATNGKDVWFSLIVPDSGSVTVQTGSVVGSTMTDTGMEVHSGACDALVLEGCNSDITAGSNLFSRVILSNQNPGETLLVRVYGYNTIAGPFMVSAFDASLGMEPIEANGFKAYPNPIKDILYLSHEQNINNVEVFNMLGQKVKSSNEDAKKVQVDMSGFAAGAYLVKVVSGDSAKTIKVIKE